MKKRFLEVDCSKLPLIVKVKGDHGKSALFALKAAGRKLGAQLVKIDQSMLHLLEQN